MGKIRIGNKQNAFLNGEYAGHVRRFLKRLTARMRRNQGKRLIRELQHPRRRYDPTCVDNRYFLL